MKQFDTDLLTWKIETLYGDTATFCKAAGIDPEQFAQEIAISDLSAQNIYKAVDALKIPVEEIGRYFFAPAPDPEPEPDYYYFFDCLDGTLSDRYLTARELAELTGAASDTLTEKEIKRIARNYEATLYRYTLDGNGNPQNEHCIYDPFDM